MIYTYSIISKPLTSEIVKNATCPVCSKKGTVEVVLYMKYASCLIPFFGLGRDTSVHCNECGHEIKGINLPLFARKNYSQEIKTAIKDIRANYKRTLWQLIYPWTFFILFGMLIIFAVCKQAYVKRTSGNNIELLNNPQIGDIYKVAVDSSSNSQTVFAVTLYRIADIKNDTVFMVRNNLTKDGMGLDENEWNDFSRDQDAFKHKQYKISAAGLKNKNLFEFYNKKTVDSINASDVIKSTDPLHFCKSIARIPDHNGIQIIERK